MTYEMKMPTAVVGVLVLFTMMFAIAFAEVSPELQKAYRLGAERTCGGQTLAGPSTQTIVQSENGTMSVEKHGVKWERTINGQYNQIK